MKSAACIVAGALLATTGMTPPDDRAPLLALLHDGRFDAARAEVARHGAGGTPDDLFFAAFVTYWQLVFEDDSTELQATLERQLDAAIDAAERATRAGAEGPAALWAGNSHLLMAQLRASERRPLSAAFEAKKAKRLLETATERGENASDAYFGLGTYNYMADTVPSYVKGLRALLFLPRGNRDKGLEQLAVAAARSPHFAFEARALLVTIYANRHERLYDEALRERTNLLEQAPDRVASLYAAARLDVSLGRNASALHHVERATARAVGLGDVHPVVLRCLDLLQARAEFASFRPDLAAETARRAIASGQGLYPGVRRDLEGLLKAAERSAAGVDWTALRDAPPGAPAPEISALAEVAPERPMLALLAGDAQLRAGQPEAARLWLDKAAAAGLSPVLLAGCQLRQGQASDLLGERTRAVDYYKRAAATPGFWAKDAAFYYQKNPFRGAP